MTNDPTTSEVIQEFHYYPFGLPLPGHYFQEGTSTANRYWYNGKELLEDVGLYAYGFRYYDPVIGRFTGVDPIADEFPWVSVFNYAENEPVANIDLHGLQKIRYDVTWFDPGLNAAAESFEDLERMRNQYNDVLAGVGGAVLGGLTFGLGGPALVGSKGAGMLLNAGRSALTLEGSATTMGINFGTDAAVQTATNLANGLDAIENYDLTGGLTSTLKSPITASLIDGVVDLTVGSEGINIEVNSAEEAMVNTAVGGAMGKFAGNAIDEIPISMNQAASVARGGSGLLINSMKSVSIETIPAEIRQVNTRVNIPIILPRYAGDN